jgi:hypothetical protein
MVEGSLNPLKRIYTKIVLGLLATVTLVDLLLCVMGLTPWSALRFLGSGWLVALLGCGAWELVERRTRDTDRPGALPWIALPVAGACGFLSLPLLALSVYPPLENFLTQDGRVAVRLIEFPDRQVVEIAFPYPTTQHGLNIGLDDHPTPSHHANALSGALTWKNAATAWLDIDVVCRELNVPRPRTISVNCASDLAPFVYRSGKGVPPQRVTLAPTSPRAPAPRR